MHKFRQVSRSKIRVAGALLLSLALCGCTIELDPAEDTVVKESLLIDSDPGDRSDPVSLFLEKCYRCIEGDYSELSDIVRTYNSSFEPRLDYTDTSFIYQRVLPTLVFERCAEKAKSDGDTSAWYEIMTRPGRIARTARYFYIQKNYREGAFWLRRIVNVKGEKEGYLTAGRIFIQDLRSMSVGVKMLEHSARLGSRDARTVLMALLQPGSMYYSTLTSEAPTAGEQKDKDLARDRSESKEDHAKLAAQAHKEVKAGRAAEDAADAKKAESSADGDPRGRSGAAAADEVTAASTVSTTAESAAGSSKTKSDASDADQSTEVKTEGRRGIDAGLQKHADRIRALQEMQNEEDE